MSARSMAAVGEVSAAARQTMERVCATRSACGRCASCQMVLRVAKRESVDEPIAETESMEDGPGDDQDPNPAGWADDPPVTEPDHEEPADKPSVRDSKPEWIEYAVACGWDRDAAEALTKADLIDELSPPTD